MNILYTLLTHKKKIFIALLCCVALSAVYGIIMLFVPQNETTNTQPTIDVQAIKIIPQNITRTTTTVGSIQYKDKAIISSKVFGRVERIFVEQGNRVHKGQILAKIETYPLELQLKEAMAELEKAHANLRLAQEKLIKAQQTAEQRLKAIAKSKLELTDKYVTLKNTVDVVKKKEQLFKAGGITQTELNSLKTNYHTIKTQFLQAKKRL